MPIATYTFLPWLRRGISNQLAAAGAGAARATVSVTLAVQSERARRDLPAVTVHLLGPGDVTAVQAQQIIRTEPRAGVTDFEPNYLAAIDFYDEDFPWRYTPVPPGGTTLRLAPWIALVVLACTVAAVALTGPLMLAQQPAAPAALYNTVKQKLKDGRQVVGGTVINTARSPIRTSRG